MVMIIINYFIVILTALKELYVETNVLILLILFSIWVLLDLIFKGE